MIFDIFPGNHQLGGRNFDLRERLTKNWESWYKPLFTKEAVHIRCGRILISSLKMKTESICLTFWCTLFAEGRNIRDFTNFSSSVKLYLPTKHFLEVTCQILIYDRYSKIMHGNWKIWPKLLTFAKVYPC